MIRETIVISGTTGLPLGAELAANPLPDTASPLIALTDRGHGRTTVILLPGIGDTKESYDTLASLLEKEYRVISMDLRGQGASAASFSIYTPEAVGQDVVDLLDRENLSRAIVVGNSMSAASAVYAATERPDALHALILTGPFVRNHPVPWYMKASLQILLRGPWAPSFWGSFYRSLHRKKVPDATDAHIRAIVSGLKEPGRLAVLRRYLLTNRDKCMGRLPRLRVPVLVVMGSADPDFKNPREEAATVAELTKGEYRILDGVGHYPHREEPERLKAWIDEWESRA